MNSGLLLGQQEFSGCCFFRPKQKTLHTHKAINILIPCSAGSLCPCVVGRMWVVMFLNTELVNLSLRSAAVTILKAPVLLAQTKVPVSGATFRSTHFYLTSCSTDFALFFSPPKATCPSSRSLQLSRALPLNISLTHTVARIR